MFYAEKERTPWRWRRAAGVLLMGTVGWVGGISDVHADTLEPDATPMRTTFSTNFARTHDRGVYGRLSLGLGYVSDRVVPGVGQAEDATKGARAMYGAHAGMLVAPRLALHLSHVAQLGADRGSLGVGGGVSFYPREDKNWLVSMSLGGVSVYDAAPDIVLGEQWGLGGEVEVGSGWWVSDHASLGMSLVGGAHAFDLDGDGIASSSWHVGVRVALSLD